jgi:hypothetical protein
MNSLQISDDLAQTIYTEAQVRGLSVENFLKDLLQRERTLAERVKIEQEQAWWFSLPLSERAKYEGKFVAVHNQTLVDYDSDPHALRSRIRAKFSNIAILTRTSRNQTGYFYPRINTNFH